MVVVVVVDGEGKKERKKEECSTTRSNYTTNNNQTKSFVTSIILFGQKVSVRVYPALWQKFKELAKTERITLSQQAERAVAEYLRHHPYPNPQLTLLPYQNPLAPSPMRVLCLHCQGALTEGKIFCQKAGMWIQSIIFYSCKNNRLRKAGKK